MIKAAFKIETFYNGSWHLTDMADSAEWAMLSQTCYEYLIGTPARIVRA